MKNQRVSYWLSQHWKPAPDLNVRRLFSIFAYLKRFGMLNDGSFFSTIPFFQRFSCFRRNADRSCIGKPLFSFCSSFRYCCFLSANPGQPLVHLRNMRIKGIDLLVENRSDIKNNIRAERIGFLKMILEIQEDRIL